jgi:hypothetical protein
MRKLPMPAKVKLARLQQRLRRRRSIAEARSGAIAANLSPQPTLAPGT